MIFLIAFLSTVFGWLVGSLFTDRLVVQAYVKGFYMGRKNDYSIMNKLVLPENEGDL